MSMVVVFGGSFNPIHIGHTEIIEQICNIEDVDKVIAEGAKFILKVKEWVKKDRRKEK